jgi:endonuclease YncB( thermonuclease family)
MKKIIAAFFLSPILAFAHDLVVPIISVTDGDTIKTILTLPCPLCYASIRIAGIDTPETNYLAKCAREKERGILATNFVKNLVKNQPVMIIKDPSWDKFGGRIDATVIVNDKNIGNELLAAGLAKPYNGTGPRPDWCN